MRMLRTGLLSLRMMLMWQKAPKIASQSQKRPQNQAPTRSRAAWSAQNLATLDNYECDNYPELDKSLLWKTSASCSGKKMWVGTLVQDNGYWNDLGWSFDCGWPAPDPLHDAEVYAYLNKGYEDTVDGQTRDVVMLYGDGGLKSMDIAAVLDGSYDVYIPVAAFNYQHLAERHVPQLRQGDQRSTPSAAGSAR